VVAVPERSKGTVQPLPENFRSIMVDFICDLNTTFPEFSYLWAKWADPALPETELYQLFEYFLTIFPERFFDILYQNDDMFKPDSKMNTCFLPNVDFKLLFHCENVSENIQKALWKYLQLILFTIVNSVKDKTNFGDAMNLFDGVDEGELQEKLKETMGSISEFFSNMENKTTDSKESKDSSDSKENLFENLGKDLPNMDEFKKSFNFDKMGSMPNADELHGHLKGLFDGKIGALAKELAEELTGDLSGILGDDMGDAKSTEDVLKKMIKNPKKIMDLMKTVGNKINSKMSSGEISKEEIMKEASELIGKMKDMGGNDQFNDLFKNLAKNMGGMGGLGGLGGMGGLGGLAEMAAGMGKMGKNMKVDTNAMSRLEKQQAMRDNMRSKLEAKKQQANYTLQTTGSPNNLVYRPNNQEQQAKSSAVRPPTNDEIDKLMNEFHLSNEPVNAPSDKSTSNKKKNKKKK
jgi:hypothetical protein